MPIAELYAFMVALNYSVPGEDGQFTFFTDCLWVVRSFEAGSESCTGASHVGAALWKTAFRLLDDRFPSRHLVSVVKVKAHISVSDCEVSQDLLWKRAGNEVADKGAKRGAALHPKDDDMLASLADYDKVIFELAQFMGNVAARRW